MSVNHKLSNQKQPAFQRLISPPQTHLDLCVVVQRPQEDLIIHALVIRQVTAATLVSLLSGEWGRHSQDLSQPQLPRRIPLQQDRRTKQDQQIRLTRDMIIDLRINQLHINLIFLHIALLRHLRKCLFQIDDGVAAVVL